MQYKKLNQTQLRMALLDFMDRTNQGKLDFDAKMVAAEDLQSIWIETGTYPLVDGEVLIRDDLTNAEKYWGTQWKREDNPEKWDVRLVDDLMEHIQTKQTSRKKKK